MKYEQIFIKSEDDLPKEDGDYIVQYNDGDIGTFPFKVSQSHWFTHIDWYLHPLAEPQQCEPEQRSAEGITPEDWMKKNGMRLIQESGLADGDFNVEGYLMMPEVYKAMIEFASLRQHQEEMASTGLNPEVYDEREALFQAYDKIRALFKGRHWLMEGRGCYPYNDERYKEEVRYIMDEFEEINTNLWKQIKSKSFEYRNKIEEPLKKRIEELELSSLWIDVKNYMPEGDVLLLTTSKVVVIGDWYKEKWRTSQSYWDDSVLKSVYQKNDITHWMPLPKAPLSQK